jgi:transposase
VTRHFLEHLAFVRVCQFTNGRQIGACVGLAPTPYHGDQHMHEQGISRSGNRRVRALSVELTWKGCCGNRTVRSVSGITPNLDNIGARAGSGSWRSRASC